MTKYKPVFVIGMERSGTKWLASILAQHPAICAPYCPQGGVFEPNFDSLGVFFEDINPHDQFIGLTELIIKTDFYKALKLPPDLPYTWASRPPNYIKFYGRLMEEYTKIHKGQYWVQKSGIPSVARLIEQYPDAHYITIRRNMIDNLKSKKAMALRENSCCQVFKMSIIYKIEYRQMVALKNQIKNFKEIDFGILRSGETNKIREIHKMLNIEEREPQITHCGNKGHSSFRSDKERKRILSQLDLIKIRIGSIIGACIPLIIWRLYLAIRPKKNRPIVRGAFLDIANSYEYKYENKSLDNLN
ncbi:MAG: sulfotransferase [Desulfobulbaceae bacterium]|nr:sulfotransferase [Desulfobulbaceae bacterium]